MHKRIVGGGDGEGRIERTLNKAPGNKCSNELGDVPASCVCDTFHSELWEIVRPLGNGPIGLLP